MSAPTRLDDYRRAAAQQPSQYAVAPATLARQLPEIGEAAAGFLCDLARVPTTVHCEQALIRLEGIRQQVAKLADALRREGGPHGAA
jgi:hypothetical protein